MRQFSVRYMTAFLVMCMLITTSCKKEKEVDPEQSYSTAQAEVREVVYAYTIKASQSSVDGSVLNLPPGSFVAIEAGTRGNLHLKNFKGAPGKPITFINHSSGKTIIKGSGSWAVKVSNCKDFRISGAGSGDKYGILIDGGHNSFTLQDLSTDFEVDHVEVKNSGFAGIMAKTDPKCDPATWRDNFLMTNISLHDNYIHDTKGEGFYVGNSFYNGKSESCGTVYPHEIHGVRIYKNITRNTGCEGIQVGCAAKDCEIYDNHIENYGTDPFANYQNNGLQIGAGTGGKCYNNIIKKGPGNGMIVNGVGGNLIFNNLILDAGSLGIFCDERTAPKEGFSFINNTIINTGSDGMRLYSEQVPMNNIINNIIINPKTGKYINTSSGVKLNEKNNYYSADMSSVKFANTSNGDYTLASSSPMINKGFDVSSFGILYDLNRISRPYGGAYDIGAFEYNGTNIPTPDPDPTPDPEPIPTPDPKIGITDLTLINADTDKDISTLKNNYEINFASIGTSKLNVRANVTSETGSVVFTLDGKNFRTEAYAPHTLAGDGNGGDYFAWTPSIGKHTLTVTPYTLAGGKGTAGTPYTVEFSVTNGVITDPTPTPVSGVTSLTLINADSDRDIAELRNNHEIDFAAIGTSKLNVRANVASGTGSVVFTLDGKNFRTEAYAPLALAGDGSGGDYYPWTPSLGRHTLTVTPYSLAGGKGTAGVPYTVEFTVSNGTVYNPTPEPNPTPNPQPGTTLQFTANQDVYLDRGKRYNQNILRVENGRRVAYMKFNVSSVSSFASARLRLKCDGDAGNGTVKISTGSHSNWTEGTLSSNSAPAIVNVIASQKTSYQVGKIYEFDLSSAIKANGTYTFIITMDAGGNDVSFSSLEGSFAPQLIIN